MSTILTEDTPSRNSGTFIQEVISCNLIEGPTSDLTDPYLLTIFVVYGGHVTPFNNKDGHEQGHAVFMIACPHH